VLVGALIAVGVLAYWPTAVALWRYWFDEPSLGGHGILVAALAVWLLARARDRTDSEPVQAAPWALLLVVPCSVAALVFWKAGLQALQLLMLPAVIWLAVLAAFGTAVARSVSVPIGYLYFAMPAWNILSVPLQELTVHAVALVAPLVGLPATVSGTSFAFPNGARFVVTLACSGVGFLAQALAVAVLLGELEDAKFARRAGLFISMALIALATNWVRVILLLAIGYSIGMDNVIVSQRHLEFGYVLFVVVLVTFVWATTRRTVPVPVPVPEPRAPRLGALAPSGYFVAITAMVAGPLLTSLWARSGDADSPPYALRMPTGQNAWRGPLPAVDQGWRPVFVGAHSEQHVAYEDSEGHRIEAVAVGYAVQHQGRELVNEGNSLLGQGGLSVLTATFVEVGESTYREVVAVDLEGNRSVIWSFYDIEGESFVVPILSQLWYGVRALTSRPGSQLFAFRAACVPSCAEARGVLQSFLRGIAPAWRGAAWRTARDSKSRRSAMKSSPEMYS
jgi:EpsI family protein